MTEYKHSDNRSDNRSDDNEQRHHSKDLLPIVYRELRQLAQTRLAKEAPGQTLTPTALVHETFLRLSSPGEDGKWDSKAHFFGAAAEAMRRILIDNARRKMSTRRGADFRRVDFETAHLSLAMTEEKAQAILNLNECLNEFEDSYPPEASLVKLRFFAGLTMEEAAEALGISRRTAQRHWAFAKASLSTLMNPDRISDD